VTKRLNKRHLAFDRDNGAYDVTAAVNNQNTAVLIAFGLLIRPAVTIHLGVAKWRQQPFSYTQMYGYVKFNWKANLTGAGSRILSLM